MKNGMEVQDEPPNSIHPECVCSLIYRHMPHDPNV